MSIGLGHVAGNLRIGGWRSSLIFAAIWWCIHCWRYSKQIGGVLPN